MSGLSILLYVEDAAFRSVVEGALEASGRVALVEKPKDLDQLGDELASLRFDAAYVDLGEKAEPLELLERLPEPRPALVLGGSRGDSEVLVRAMHLRPEAFIVDRKIDELSEILARLQRNRPGTSEAHGVIAVAGAKGGVGTTFVACELAAALQRIGDRVAVVDLDLYQGDVAIYFDLTPPYSLADIARKGENLDGDFLRTVSAEHELGLSLVAAPRLFEDASLIGPRHIERTIRLLRRDFDWVILDVPKDWSDACLKALDLADLVLLVTGLEVPALTHTRDRLKLLERLGAPEEQVRVLINRCASGQLSGWDFGKALGRKPDATLPSDYGATLASINEGKLIREVAAGGRIDLSIQQLAASVYDWFDLGEIEIDRTPSLSRRIGAGWNHLRNTVKGVRNGTAE